MQMYVEINGLKIQDVKDTQNNLFNIFQYLVSFLLI